MLHYETLAEITDLESAVSEKPPLHTKPMSPTEYPKGSPAQARRMKTHNEDELRELILATQKRFKDATDEEVLNVLPDFSSDEIQKAYNNLTSIFHPPYFSFDRFKDLKDPLEEIINRMAEAHHNLMQREAARHPFELGIIEDSEESSAETAEEVPRFITNRMEDKITPDKEPPTSPGDELFVVTNEVSENIKEDLDEEPANTILLRALGKMLQTSGKAIDAEKHLLRALEIEPRNLENHFALVDFYHSQGLKFKAFKHLNMILQLDPQNQKALDSLGVKKRKHLFEISPEDSTHRH
jgi:tetratricopeptide (TPR) repeat protein